MNKRDHDGMTLNSKDLKQADEPTMTYEEWCLERGYDPRTKRYEKTVVTHE